MEAVNKLIAYVIPVVVLILIVVFFFGGEGGFTKVKSAFNKTKSYLPDITIGAEKLQAEKPRLPPDHEKAVRDLVGTIKKMVDSKRQHCFETYAGLPELGEKGTVIRLSAGSIKTYILGGRQEITDLNRELSSKIKGFRPCVIATESVVESFKNVYLNDLSWSEKKKLIESNPPSMFVVDNIVIEFDGENKINYGYGKKDLEDGGFLYVHGTADGFSFICFFPTVEFVQGANDGLNDDYLGEDSSPNSLRRQLQEKRIPPCTGPWEEEEGQLIAPQSPPSETLPGGVADGGVPDGEVPKTG